MSGDLVASACVVLNLCSGALLQTIPAKASGAFANSFWSNCQIAGNNVQGQSCCSSLKCLLFAVRKFDTSADSKSEVLLVFFRKFELCMRSGPCSVSIRSTGFTSTLLRAFSSCFAHQFGALLGIAPCHGSFRLCARHKVHSRLFAILMLLCSAVSRDRNFQSTSALRVVVCSPCVCAGRVSLLSFSQATESGEGDCVAR